MAVLRNAPEPVPSTLAAALDYAKRGIPVFTLTRSKVPFAGSHGHLDATTDAQTIIAWLRDSKRRHASIGIPMGAVSGLLVIEDDPRHGGASSLDLLEQRYGSLPSTYTVRSGSGGYHRYFRHPGVYIKSKANRFGDEYAGVDVKGDGGYVVVPPSLHPNGKRYELVQDMPFADLPRAWLDALVAGQPAAPQLPPGAFAGTESFASDGAKWLDWAVNLKRDGTSDFYGFQLAIQLLANRCEDVDHWLHEYAYAATCDPSDPFTQRDISRWIRSAQNTRIVQRGEPAKSRAPRSAHPVRKYHQNIPESAAPDNVTPFRPPKEPPPPEEPTPDGSEHCTDMGNARRFVKLHGANVRYVAAWGTWFMWDGKRWRKDETDAVARLAKLTVRAMWHEVADIEDAEARKEFIKWIYKSESSARLSAMLDVARSEPEIAAHHSAFDADLWQFNCLNGTLDLRRGQLHDHRREDLITKLAPVEYRSGAALPLWDKFIATVTDGDTELAAFLRRAVGYTLTGSTAEEKLFFAHGPTRTGKSTFFEAIKATMGDYAQTADFETFLARSQVGGIRNDVADLVGARMVASIEVDDGKKLAAGLVKTITGGDSIKARHLYKEGFTFWPNFKLWLAANDEPRVDAADGGMWSRILRIKFDAHITKKDPRVKAVLRDPAKSGAAILAWAVRGCIEWQHDGLGVPQAVTAATDEYRQSMDPLRDFLTDCCEMESESWVASSGLREVYEKWCKANGEKWPLPGKRFGEALKRHGCTQDVRRMGATTVRGWRGLRIAAEV